MFIFCESRRPWFVTALVAVGVISGCQSSPEQQIKEAFKAAFPENGRRVAVLYARCMASPTRPTRGPNDFSGPIDESSLRRFIAGMSSEALAEMGIASAEAPDLFMSERDGQPFRVRYGIRGPLTTTYAVLCESKGVDGKVKVFKSDGSFVEVAADEAEKYMSGEHDVAYDPESGL